MARPTNIIKKTLLGISKAHKDYERWTYGYWYAPEYMITTYIAKEIAKLEPDYVGLEQDAKESIKEAGGLGRGRHPHGQTSTYSKFERGKFDIVVWDGDVPILIEVKNRPDKFSAIRGDVDNICRALKGEKTSIQYSLIAYYSAWEKTENESAEKRTSRIVEEIKCEAEAHIEENKGLKLIQHLSHTKPKVVGDSAWAWIGVVLKISKA